MEVIGKEILMRKVPSKYKYKAGVVLARMQPLHIAHMFLIAQALIECEKVYVFLGSANKHGTKRNPLPSELRLSILRDAILNSGWSKSDTERIVGVYDLPDWSFENDSNKDANWYWGQYLYFNVVSRTQTKEFAIYYSDGREQIESWFTADHIKKFVHIRTFERNDLFDGLSATKVREAIVKGNDKYLFEFLPYNVVINLPMIRGHFEHAAKNPIRDSAMK
jgi:nicotinamide-nucleotide adenylyltransferase